MGIQVQTEFRGNVSSHLKLAIFKLIKNGEAIKEQVVHTGLSNVLFASANNSETGKSIKCKYGKNPCILVGPLSKSDRIVRLKAEGI